jgi:PD-(D/E)XK nuclease superfamily
MPTDLPGPSSFGRMAVCIASEAYPHVNRAGGYASYGTLLHSFFANALMYGRARALKLAPPEDETALSEIDLSRLPAFDPRAYAPEVSLAWHLESDEIRELGRNLSRDEARARARTGEVVGTLDVVGLTPTTAVVWDYKTGWRAVEPPESNWQLMTYGLLAYKRWKRDHVQQGIIRAPPGMDPRFLSAEMTTLDLSLHENRVRDLLEERERVQTLGRAGKWDEIPAPVEDPLYCTYCPAQDFCPAKRQGIDNYAEMALKPATHAITNEMKAGALRKAKLVQMAINRVMAVLKDMARQEPFPLGDDEVFGERLLLRETIIPEVARQVFTEMWGEELSHALMSKVKVEVTLSKEDLRSGIREFVLPLVPNGKITAMVEAALNRLRAAGAISARPEYRVEAYTPGRAVLREGPKLLPDAGSDVP